jgi:sulfur carrier protein ThiS adenylyltransferase
MSSSVVPVKRDAMSISLKINGIERRVPARSKLLDIRGEVAPAADVAVLNGAAVSEDVSLRDGDEVFFLKRGEMPSEDALEALMSARHTPGVHAKLKAATVGIAGLGGLGSTAALALARTGIGRLVLADFDIVEPTNLNRQQYSVSQIGLSKTEALSANVAAANPYVEVDARTVMVVPENALEIFGGVDVMIEAFDVPEAKAMLARVFRAERPEIPFIAASGVAGYGLEEDIQVRCLGGGFHVVGDLESDARPGRGLMAPRVGIAACMQANLALRLIVDGKA